MDIEILIDNPNLLLGIVEAHDVSILSASDAFRDLIEKRVSEVLTPDFEMPEVFRKGIRDLLKAGGFKCSGRNKPASEYLIQTVKKDGTFMYINNAVDANNFISLKSFLPISVLDARELEHGVVIRYGLEDEAYVFNPAGQAIDLEGLIVVCARDPGGSTTPLGNPVKDSMRGKLKAGTKDLLGVIYASRACIDKARLLSITEEFGEVIRRFCEAGTVKARVVGND